MKSNIRISVFPMFHLARPLWRFCLSFNVCTTFWSRSLFSFDSDPKRLETTVSRSMSAQVSLMPVRLAIRPDEPSFSKVGTVPAAVCWLLFDAPECRGKLRSSKAAIVASYSCWKPMFLVGRLIGVCSPLTSVQSRIGQMARRSTPELSYTWV